MPNKPKYKTVVIPDYSSEDENGMVNLHVQKLREYYLQSSNKDRKEIRENINILIEKLEASIVIAHFLPKFVELEIVGVYNKKTGTEINVKEYMREESKKEKLYTEALNELKKLLSELRD